MHLFFLHSIVNFTLTFFSHLVDLNLLFAFLSSLQCASSAAKAIFAELESVKALSAMQLDTGYPDALPARGGLLNV
jgi:hypothetical protein